MGRPFLQYRKKVCLGLFSTPQNWSSLKPYLSELVGEPPCTLSSISMVNFHPEEVELLKTPYLPIRRLYFHPTVASFFFLPAQACRSYSDNRIPWDEKVYVLCMYEFSMQQIQPFNSCKVGGFNFIFTPTWGRFPI